jgi:uncharacterized Ntn-hydrolase superfamily protein
MTWSILAVDADGAVGVAVASRFFAVGALCPHARSSVGALSTQALVNPRYAAPALAAMARGADPMMIVAEITGADPGRDHRQFHLIDVRGRIGAHTGTACIEWCGHLQGPGFSIAGNMLVGPQVLAATADAYVRAQHKPFAERLLDALIHGDAAGGDKRGKQAAALMVYTTEDYPALDLRVDDHDEPFIELSRLYRKSLERFQPFVSCLPTQHDPAGITDRAVIEATIARWNAEQTPSTDR